jgi:exodeoxyribonuclease VII small subunit
MTNRASSKSEAADTENMSFESAFEALETIVAQLESGELSLEESVTLFERGRKFSAHCQSLLDQAELRITQLDDDGNLRTMS